MNHRTQPGAGGDHDDCRIMHVDMDAFFVGVELLDAPELRGRPVIVGSATGRSVVLSASYEARAYGVGSAMPMAAARRLCPQAVIVEPHRHKYTRVSAQLMDIFASVTDQVEPLSVDEAFLDVSAAIRRLGSPPEIGRWIRGRVREELGITASVGIASAKFVAKIASTRAKPDGMLVIPAAGTVDFLHTLPISALWGVGPRSRQALERVGISTVADAAHTPVSVLRRVLGATGEHVHRLAWGHDDRRVQPHREEKSIGAEQTFDVDTAEDAPLQRELLRLSHRTASRLRADGVQCRTVSIKVRYSDLRSLTRSRTLTEPTDSAHDVYAAALNLLSGLGTRPKPVRLIGVRAEGLEGQRPTQQLSLERSDGNWRAAEEALDAVNRRFGGDGVRPARLFEAPEGETGRR